MTTTTWRRLNLTHGYILTGQRATYWVEKVNAPSESTEWRLKIRFKGESGITNWEYDKTAKALKAEAERLEAAQ